MLKKTTYLEVEAILSFVSMRYVGLNIEFDTPHLQAMSLLVDSLAIGRYKFWRGYYLYGR
jgi:hypothetical protein